MKLYKIMFTHWSQKDSATGIVEHFVGENDEAVYEYIKSQDSNYDREISMFTSWTEYEEANSYYDEDVEEEDKGFEIYDDDYNVIGTETFKERMLRLGGEMFDEDQELNDLYYGATRFGWKEVGEILPTEIAVLKNVGILK